MYKSVDRKKNRLNRVRRIQLFISGTAERPRLVVFRSLLHTQAQLIDDISARTLASASDKTFAGTRLEKAKQVGVAIGNAAKAKKIRSVVFDRAGNQYHGRVAAVAQGARESGLDF